MTCSNIDMEKHNYVISHSLYYSRYWPIVSRFNTSCQLVKQACSTTTIQLLPRFAKQMSHSADKQCDLEVKMNVRTRKKRWLMQKAWCNCDCA